MVDHPSHHDRCRAVFLREHTAMTALASEQGATPKGAEMTQFLIPNLVLVALASPIWLGPIYLLFHAILRTSPCSSASGSTTSAERTPRGSSTSSSSLCSFGRQSS